MGGGEKLCFPLACASETVVLVPSWSQSKNRPSLYFLAEKRRRQIFCKFQNHVIRSETVQCSGERMFNQDMSNRK